MTYFRKNYVAHKEVSTHAPAWGATQVHAVAHEIQHVFQLTRPRGARPRHPRPPPPHQLVSTHAPAWGATPSSPTRQTPRWRGFNSRARVGRDQASQNRRVARRRFNSRARVGRDPRAGQSRLPRSWFQLTRPRGARPRRLRLLRHLRARFNSRARVGRDPDTPARRSIGVKFQLTRPRGARRAARRDKPRVGGVSTHAPAWGATTACSRMACSMPVSTHAPAWGATISTGNEAELVPVFQLTRPRGARLRECCIRCTVCRVSTHAPAWGATHNPAVALTFVDCFNSRARVGRDRRPCRLSSQSSGFNSRARVGRD